MRNVKRRRFFRRVLPVAGINAFAWLTVLFFAPSEVFAGNVAAFEFGYDSVWPPMLALALGTTVVLTAVEALLPKLVRRIVCLLTFAFGLCCYVQSGFLNGEMASLAEGAVVYSRTLKLTNAFIWAAVTTAVLAVAFILGRKRGMASVLRGTAAVGAALVLMQAVGLASMLPSMLNAAPKLSGYTTTKKDLTLSDGRNTVVFIFDTSSCQTIEQALAENPALFDGLDGFTYYPNMTTTYSRTYPSVPYLLTGENCWFDMPYRDWVQAAFEKSTFLPTLSDQGISIGLYTHAGRLGDSILPKLVNGGSVASGDATVSTAALVKNMVTMSLYRNAPYVLKRFFRYEPDVINAEVVILPSKYNFSDYEDVMHRALLEKGITVEKGTGAFRFYHFFGPHPGTMLTAEGFLGESETERSEAFAGDIALLRTYVSALKQAGVYDNTTIIVTADHGHSGGNTDTLDMPFAAGALLLVKPAGATGETVVSAAPVCHEDLFATIYESFGLDGSAYGRTIDDIAEGEQRSRLYYYSALYNDLDGEVALREYEVSGDARLLESYQPTGSWWDIVHSQNIVSDKAFVVE